MTDLNTTIRALGLPRLAIMGAVFFALVVFFVYISTRAASGDYAPLYTDLAVSDAGAMTARLDALQIPWRVSGDGTVIMVEHERIGEARMALAREGLPRGDAVGYELFDQDSSLTASSFSQSINRLRALEGELTRTLESLEPVQKARVQLVLPEREMFSRRQQAPSASVTLALNAHLDRGQVRAVQHLVAAAVPDLKPNQVTILDAGGILLTKPQREGDGVLPGGDDDDELRRQVELELVGKIESLVASVVGPGNVSAQVTAQLDFDRITQEQESFDPDQQVLRSSSSTQSNENERDSQGQDQVSVQTNLPPGQQASPPGPQDQSSRAATESSEQLNYEIGRTVQRTIRQVGAVKRLSVAVLVNGVTNVAADGTRSYAPRSDADLKIIEGLVQRAIGFDADRGDTVQVTNLPFVRPVEALTDPDAEQLFGLPKTDVMQLAETGILGLVALLVTLLVVRPLMNRALEVQPIDPALLAASAQEEGMTPLITHEGNIRLLPERSMEAKLATMTPDQRREIEQLVTTGEVNSVEEALDQMISISQVEGRVRASSLSKIGDIVEKHPDETVSIIRNWMYQET